MGIIGANQRTIIMAPPLPPKNKKTKKSGICEHEVSQLVISQKERKKERGAKTVGFQPV